LGTAAETAVAKTRLVSEVQTRKENVMETTEHGDNEKRELRAKLDAAVEKAKAVCERLQEKTAAAAKTTDKAVREHPYQAVGIAFGLGMLIGVLVARCRRGED
jgi:ElaB/YqjD/DUF883 family membrane-anchored ribosome-binding protein